LRVYWKWRKSKDWLFPGERPDHPLFQNAVRGACQKLRNKLGITKPLSRMCCDTFLRDTSARCRTRSAQHSVCSSAIAILRPRPATCISEARLQATASPLDDLPIRVVRIAQGGIRRRQLSPQNLNLASADILFAEVTQRLDDKRGFPLWPSQSLWARMFELDRGGVLLAPHSSAHRSGK
jgi:hypothetical protein